MRPLAVTDEADEFTINSRRTRCGPYQASATECRSEAVGRAPAIDETGTAGPENSDLVGAPEAGQDHRYEHRRLRQADPRPGGAREARGRPHPRSQRQADPRRVRLVRRRDGPATRGQG